MTRKQGIRELSGIQLGQIRGGDDGGGQARHRTWIQMFLPPQLWPK